MNNDTLRNPNDARTQAPTPLALRSLWVLVLGLIIAVLLAGVALGAALASASPSGAVMADGMTAAGGDRLAALAGVAAAFFAMVSLTAGLWRHAGKMLR